MKRIIILIISGPMKGEKYIVETESPVLIGRNQRTAINILKDPSVSRKYALIYWRDRDCYIKDLQSTNRETCLLKKAINLTQERGSG